MADIYERCFYCNHCKSPFGEDDCLFGRSPITCETWSPNKRKIVQYADSMDISITDLISLIQLRGYKE